MLSGLSQRFFEHHRDVLGSCTTLYPPFGFFSLSPCKKLVLFTCSWYLTWASVGRKRRVLCWRGIAPHCCDRARSRSSVSERSPAQDRKGKPLSTFCTKNVQRRAGRELIAFTLIHTQACKLKGDTSWASFPVYVLAIRPNDFKAGSRGSIEIAKHSR